MSDFSQDQTMAPAAPQSDRSHQSNGSNGNNGQQAAENPRKLFVGNLSWGITTEDLQQLFAEFGSVEEAFVLTDKFSGRSKGFGFVTMSTAEEAAAAIEGLHQREVDGRQLAVNVAQPPRPRTEWGSGDRNDRRPSGGGSDRRSSFGSNDRRPSGGGSDFRRGR